MENPKITARVLPLKVFLIGCAGALVATVSALAIAGAPGQGQKSQIDPLRIGASPTLDAKNSNAKEDQANLATLQAFIRDETGLNNEIVKAKDWQDLAEKMSKKTFHLGVFQGYEFAWATEKYPGLKPLALAVNVYRYPIAYVVAHHTNPATDFAGLKGQSFVLPNTGQPYLDLFVEHEVRANGKTLTTFFSKVVYRDNIQDVIDDVVDGVVPAGAANRAALDEYKQRQPGRFKNLKEVIHSPPLPPIIIASCDNVLDESTLKVLRDGLLNANRKEKGQTMLTLFKLTGFDTIPPDFEQVLDRTRRTYSPSEAPKIK
jgi:ABC-type phosphate/phosphonate transport system substrate-binding protein